MLVAKEGCWVATVCVILTALPDWSFQNEMGVLLVLLEVPASAFSQNTLLADEPTPAGPVCARERKPLSSSGIEQKNLFMATQTYGKISGLGWVKPLNAAAPGTGID